MKTQHLRKRPFLWEWLFLLWVRRKCVPKNDYWRPTELITLVLFNTTYLTNELHTHTHTYSHSLLCRLNQRSLTHAVMQPDRSSGSQMTPKTHLTFSHWGLSLLLLRSFCFYFFPLLCKVRVVTRPPTQTPLTVRENFSRTQNTWTFLWPANGNLKIDNATNHSPHETR